MERSLGFTSLLVLAMLAPASTGAVGQTRKPAGEEWTQVKPLFALVEQVAAGKPPPTDLTLAWQCHFVNADAGVVFVPFTIVVEGGGLSSFPVAMYVRVVARGAPAPAPGPRDALAQYPFEDAAIVDRLSNGRISRAFTAPPGAYDVYIALTERPTIEAPSPRTGVLKQAVDVPDLSVGLTTSSVIVAEHVTADGSSRRPGFEEQLDNPYSMWGMTLTPATTSTFARSQVLSLAFLIYNTAPDRGDKPDVEVQYNFHRRKGGRETFFGTTRPEVFDAGTLRPEFSLSAGDLIVAGREVPLSTFPVGDYRLEIKVIDRVTAGSIIRDVVFSVAGP